MGPRDVVGNTAVGVLDNDLRAACLGALKLSRAACRAFALDAVLGNERAAVHRPRQQGRDRRRAAPAAGARHSDRRPAASLFLLKLTISRGAP